ncbi:MAG: primosomal protein N' [Pseudomonadota bacterium]
MSKKIAEVAVALPLKETYHYEVPEELAAQVGIGQRVLVPVKARRATGYILSFPPESDYTLKPLDALLDPIPAFPEQMVPLFRWLADYYFYPIGQAIKAALPAGLLMESHRLLKATGKRPLPESALPREVLAALEAVGQTSAARLKKVLGGRDLTGAVSRLRESGHLVVVERMGREACRPCFEQMVSALPGAEQAALFFRKPALAAMYGHIAAEGECSLGALRERFSGVAAKLRQLQAAGVVEVRQVRLYRSPFEEEMVAAAPPDLNSEQQGAVDAIEAALGSGGFSPLLLQGITGSGKTEVYLRAAALTLALGKGVLVLVPEIALSAQNEDLFRARFGERVAVLHSGLSRGQRLDEWERVRSGGARVVVGARSAIFAPMAELGLIIVDEEHESAYKQEDGLRYHGRDVALVRGRMAKAVVVLGSATPSMQSLHHARSGRYGLLKLTWRATRVSLPAVEVVDLKDTGGIFSPKLREAVGQALAKNTQVLLYLNRRGYATYCLCAGCGRPVGCPNCQVSLTYHAPEERLRCHYCGFSSPAALACGHCGGTHLRLLGLCSQKVEVEARGLWPEARVVRMDSDVLQTRSACLSALKQIRRGEVDIIIGTQIMAKGHDLPGLSLVGVILADESLGLPDFRAAERGFQALAQVAGRAGRVSPGRVILQAYDPNHYALAAACAHDCGAFFDEEAPLRREMRYPPFSRMARLVVSSTSAQAALSFCCDRLATLARGHFDSQDVLGPAPAPLSKLKGRYRWHLLLRGAIGGGLHRSLRGLLAEAEKVLPPNVGLIVDIDPLDML